MDTPDDTDIELILADQPLTETLPTECEPVLVIRASDPMAVSVAMEYAREVEDAGFPQDVFTPLFDVAYRIREWQSKNPDKVRRVE